MIYMQNEGYKRPDFVTDVKIEVDKDRAYEVFDHIVDLYQKNMPPYNEFILPQEYKPASLRPELEGNLCGTKSHAMYYFNSCIYMSKRTDSKSAMRRMTWLFDNEPDMFVCEKLCEMSSKDVAEKLQYVGFGMYDQAADELIENARRLQERYDGDPTKIYSDTKDWNDCLIRTINDKNGGGFLGFQEKMTDMILYFFRDDDLIPELNFPTPPDGHNYRNLFATDIAIPNKPAFFRHKSGVVEISRNLTMGYNKDRNLDPRILTNATWSLGANLCSNTPGNVAPHKRIDGAMHYKLAELDMNNMRTSERWLRTCGKCALQNYCNHYVPLSIYYNSGGFVLLPKEEDESKKVIIQEIELNDTRNRVPLDPPFQPNSKKPRSNDPLEGQLHIQIDD